MGCEECEAMGSAWVYLRACLVCGRVLCCDISPNNHAAKHFEETGHAVIRSLEPREHWGWCYVHKEVLELY
jgi:uncharacterized UBP type Zn finger protein